VFTGSSESGLL